jgi:hypothetical protein
MSVDNKLGLAPYFSSLLPNISPDRLVVENLPLDKVAINNDSRYQIIFENKLGLVAKLIQ